MHKLIGYTIFWIAVGMLIMLIIGCVWVGLIIIAILMFAGYVLFSCK